MEERKRCKPSLNSNNTGNGTDFRHFYRIKVHRQFNIITVISFAVRPSTRPIQSNLSCQKTATRLEFIISCHGSFEV